VRLGSQDPLQPSSRTSLLDNWRLEKTTGHGHLVDWGIHLVDVCRVILDLITPTRIIAGGGLCHLKDKITTRDILSVHFEFEPCPT